VWSRSDSDGSPSPADLSRNLTQFDTYLHMADHPVEYSVPALLCGTEMSEPLHDPSAIPLDDDGRITINVACVNCGYNLRTLLASGVCPECAAPVAHSAHGYFLSFAPPDWVRRLARGVLLLIIAMGLLIGGAVLLPTIMAGLVFRTSPGPPSLSALGAMTFVQFGFITVVTVLAGYGIWCVTAQAPAAAGRPEGRTARRVLRVCVCVLAASYLLGLLMTPFWFPMTSGTMPAWPFSAFNPVLMVLAIVNGVVALAASIVTPLALLRLLMGLMHRVPRPGLALFCRIEFWGGLVSGSLVVLGYAGVFLLFVLPMVKALPTMVPVPASGPFAATSAPSGPVTTVQTWGGTTYTYQSGTQYVSSSGQVVTSWPTTSPTGSMPTTMMAMPTPPPIGPAFMFTSCLTGVGGCAAAGFAVAGIVLLILVQRTLSQAAREAAENATLGSPVASTPFSER